LSRSNIDKEEKSGEKEKKSYKEFHRVLIIISFLVFVNDGKTLCIDISVECFLKKNQAKNFQIFLLYFFGKHKQTHKEKSNFYAFDGFVLFRNKNREMVKTHAWKKKYFLFYWSSVITATDFSL
jgi:hypothetical protein